MPANNLQGKQAGFTLIEVLAALSIFSFAILGLTMTGAQSARGAAMLEEKSLAGIVADNRLILARADNLKRGVQSGEEELMNRRFTYRLETEQTELDGLYSLTVQVSLAGQDQVIIERVAYRQGVVYVN